MGKTRQDKTRQDKTRQDKTRQDKTRQDKTRQDKTRQDDTGEGESNIEPDITRPQIDIQRPKHLADYDVDWSGACSIGIYKPESYQETVNGDNAVEWKDAID